MSEPTPVEMLEAEHRVIQKVVAAMAVLAERFDGGEDGQERVRLLRRRASLLREVIEQLELAVAS